MHRFIEDRGMRFVLPVSCARTPKQAGTSFVAVEAEGLAARWRQDHDTIRLHRAGLHRAGLHRAGLHRAGLVERRKPR
ncbi:MAG: hypothetical protein EBZ59_11240 [Planctomycetia bacterium]|nr:hypothetical protein [Planctomycetia bacterium]